MKNINVFFRAFKLFIILSLFLSTSVLAYSNTYPYGNEETPSTNCLGDAWGFCKWNCTSYVAWKVREKYLPNFVNGFYYNGKSETYGHAYNWVNAAQNHGFVVSSNPFVGAIAVWQPNKGYASNSSYGHVAFVEAVNSDGSIAISQYNENFSGAYSERQLSGSNLDSVQYIKFGETISNSCSGSSTMILSGVKDNYLCNPSTQILINPSSQINPESNLYVN